MLPYTEAVVDDLKEIPELIEDEEGNAPACGIPSLRITPPGSASPPLKIRGGKGEL